VKRDLGWHKKCWENSERSIRAARDNLARETIRLEAMQRDNDFRSAQITEAERRGLDGFDADKFMKKRTA